MLAYTTVFDLYLKLRFSLTLNDYISFVRNPNLQPLAHSSVVFNVTRLHDSVCLPLSRPRWAVTFALPRAPLRSRWIVN